jgi:hypothetical protein
LAKIAFKNILEDSVDFTPIDKPYLYECVIDYAVLQEDEVTQCIFYDYITITLNDKVIDPSYWGTVLVEQDDEIVITPALGKGKTAAILMLVVAVALIAFAPTLSGMLGVSTGKIVMTGVSLGLGAISNLLFQPTLPTLNTPKSLSDSKTYSWSGIKTTATEDTAIDVVYGTHPVGGNIISAYTHAYDQTNYLYMLIALGEGPIDGICQLNNLSNICLTSDFNKSSLYRTPAIYLDDQTIDKYEGIDWWYRVGANKKTPENDWELDAFYRKGDTVSNLGVDYYCIEDNTSEEVTEPGTGDDWEDYWDIIDKDYCPFVQNKIKGFSQSRSQVSIESTVKNEPDYIFYTTTKDVDSISLQMRTPALYSINPNDENASRQHSIMYKVQYKKASDPTYEDAIFNRWETSFTGPSAESATYNKAYYSYGNIPLDEYTLTVLDIGELPYTVDYTQTDVKEEGEVVRDLSYTYYPKDREIVLNVKNETTNEEEIITKVFRNYKEAVTINIGIYWITIKGTVNVDDVLILKSVSASSTTEVAIAGETKSQLYQSLNYAFPERDTYDLRIQRVDGGVSSSFYVENQLYLSSVTEIIEGEFIYPGTALLGLKIKASEQLSGGPPNVKVKIRGLKVQVPDLEYSGGEKARFDSTVFDGTDWKESYGTGETLTWDGETWRDEEFSNNSVVVTRDLMTNSRYGLGEYLESADFSDTRMEEAVEDCSLRYSPVPDGFELLTWWDDASRWPRNWRSVASDYQEDAANLVVTPPTSFAFSFDSTQSTNLSYYLYFYLDSTLGVESGQSYTISFDYEVTSGNASGTSISFHTHSNPRVEKDVLVPGNLWSNPTTGTLTKDVTMPAGTSGILLNFYRLALFGDIDFNISNLSITYNAEKYEKYHTWDGVLDSNQAAITVLLEMCSVFRCWPVWYNGKFNFVIDKDETPVHSLSKGNTIDFEQSFVGVSEIPSRLIGQFTDKSIEYELRSIRAISEVSTLNKLNESVIGLKGITSINKAIRETKFMLNKLINCTKLITVRCGGEHLHATAGDLIYVQDDLPSWGHGGRLLDYNSTTPSVTIDSEYYFSPEAVAEASYLVKYQLEDNSYQVATLAITSSHEGSTLQIMPLKTMPQLPKEDAVYQLGHVEIYAKPHRLISVQRVTDDTVEFTALNHVASVYDEDTDIKVVNDKYSTGISPLTQKPKPPINIDVRRLPPTEGIGFLLRAEPGDSITKEIVVEMSTGEGSFAFNHITSINMETNEAKYVNNNLRLTEGSNIYNFQFVGQSATGVRSFPSRILNVELSQENYILPAPKGVRVKGKSYNDLDSYSNHMFDGRDLTVVWNPVGAGSSQTQIVIGYRILVYKNTLDKSNLIWDTEVSTTEWTFFLAENTSVAGGPYSTLILEISTLSIGHGESPKPKVFRVKNSTPASIVNLEAKPITGGVTFSWDKNTETDLECYEYKLSIGSGAYSNPVSITDNSVVRILTADEIATYGNKALISIEVRSKDVYGQTSSYTSTSTNANTISDDIFILASTKSGGTGNVASLYDGVLDSGGVTII